MNSAEQIADLIVKQGMLPLYFNADETVSIEVLRALYKAGIKAIEYTNRGEAALKNFTKLIEIRNTEMPGLMLGVGTIKNLQQASLSIIQQVIKILSPYKNTGRILYND